MLTAAVNVAPSSGIVRPAMVMPKACQHCKEQLVTNAGSRKERDSPASTLAASAGSRTPKLRPISSSIGLLKNAATTPKLTEGRDIYIYIYIYMVPPPPCTHAFVLESQSSGGVGPWDSLVPKPFS